MSKYTPTYHIFRVELRTGLRAPLSATVTHRMGIRPVIISGHKTEYTRDQASKLIEEFIENELPTRLRKLARQKTTK